MAGTEVKKDAIGEAGGTVAGGTVCGGTVGSGSGPVGRIGSLDIRERAV